MMMDYNSESTITNNNSNSNINNKTSSNNNVSKCDSPSDNDRTLIASGGQNDATTTSIIDANEPVDVHNVTTQRKSFGIDLRKNESPNANITNKPEEIMNNDIKNLLPPIPSTQSITCRFFTRGICRFHSMCMYSHDQPSNMYKENYPLIMDGNTNDFNVEIENGASGHRPDYDHDQDKPSTSNSSCNNSNINICNNSKHHTNDSDETINSTNNNEKNTNIKSYNVSTNGWVNAPVFIPKPLSQRNIGHIGTISGYHQYHPQLQQYGPQQEPQINQTATPLNYSWADIVGGINAMSMHNNNGTLPNEATGIMELCPYESPCPYGNYCGYNLHWELCEMCDQYCLHPKDENQRKIHKKECLQQHEQAMELSFAIARSKDKTCGICFETIMEKSGHEKRFGILSNCNHIFCLECIRKWRQAKQFENKITRYYRLIFAILKIVLFFIVLHYRSCPECRVSSDFVCPSAFWVETKEEKEKLLNDYRKALGIKDCKYFKKV